MKTSSLYVFVCIAVIVISTLYSTRKTRTENFETTLTSNGSLIKFLSLTEAREVFLSDAFDYYRDYSRKESVAKTKLRELPLTDWQATVRQCYLDTIEEFDDDEKSGITEFILGNKYLRRLPWKFIKMPDHMDFSFPYTLGDCIVLPTHLARSIANNVSPKSNFTTLCHENIHILQRSNPKAYKKYYESSWNYRYDPHLVIPDRLRVHMVINPDGYERLGGWIALVEGEEYYYCLCLGEDLKLSKRAYKVGSSVGRRYVDDNQYTPLEKFAKYQNGVLNCYHPNEEYAYLMSERLQGKYDQVSRSEA